MPLYELTKERIVPIAQTTFAKAGYLEREDLQRLFKDQIEVLVPDAYVLKEEFCEWDGSLCRIDLLLIDRDANLVVLELKRTQDGGAMELQALRYAAMVSTMTFEQAVVIHQAYLDKHGRDNQARQQLLGFLGWEEPDEDTFAQEVRIVLASADFSKELTTSVLWLNHRGLDIRCIRLRPFADGDRVLLDVQQVIPIPEAEEYQIKVQHKASQERSSRGPTWNEAKLLKAISEKYGAAASDAAEKLLRGMEELGFQLSYGTAKEDGRAFASINLGGKNYFLARIATHRGLVLPLARLQMLPLSVRRTIADRWSEATGVPIDDGALNTFPALPLNDVVDQDRFEKFFQFLRAAIEVIEGEAIEGAETTTDIPSP
jgi:hypothetical protein